MLDCDEITVRAHLFDKIKFEFFKKHIDTLSYLDCLQHIHLKTILDFFKDQTVKLFIESALKEEYYEGKIHINSSQFLFVKKEGDLFHTKIAPDESINTIKEDIILTKIDNNLFAILNQKKIGSSIPNFQFLKILIFLMKH